MLIGERGKFLQLFFFPLAIIHFAIMTIKVDSLSKLSLVWHTDTHHTAIWRSITMIDYVWPTKLNLRNTSNYVHTSSLILGNAFQKKKKFKTRLELEHDITYVSLPIFAAYVRVRSPVSTNCDRNSIRDDHFNYSFPFNMYHRIEKNCIEWHLHFFYRIPFVIYCSFYISIIIKRTTTSRRKKNTF